MMLHMLLFFKRLWRIFEFPFRLEICTSIIEVSTFPGQNLILKIISPYLLILRKLTKVNYMYHAYLYFFWIGLFYENNLVKGLRNHVCKIELTKILLFVC